jgi:hypothetical protein
MDKFPLTIRLRTTEKQMLRKRAAKYGLTINSLIRFWVNSEPSSPRAFSKVKCSACSGTGKIAVEYKCNNCRVVEFSYYEI